MQVQRIQNNNNYNTNFGAKFKIKGHYDDIPAKVLEEWANKAKKIGTESDSVLINLDQERMIAYNDYNHFGNTTRLFGRNVSISKLINGKMSNDIGALYESKPFNMESHWNGLNDAEIIGDQAKRLSKTISAISEYLDKFIK